jgi:Ca2+/Na+ antiporter
MLNDISGCSVQDSSLQDQLKETIQDCKLSYKNMVTAGLIGSLTGTKFKLGGNGMSHPVIFTIALAMKAPFIVLWSLMIAAIIILLGGGINAPSVIMLCGIYFVVEVLIPWINSYYIDPIEEPWLIPKWLDENGIER